MTRILSILVALCLIALPASALTIFNNFGPDHDGWDYNWGTGWTIAGDDVAAQYGVEQALGFTASSSGILSDIWVAMWYVPIDGGADEVTMYLVEGSLDHPPAPGDVMTQWTITDFESWTGWSPPHHLAGDPSVELVAGQSYWLWAVGSATTWCGWCMNSDPSSLAPHTIKREGEDWLPVSNETAGAFRVDITPAVTIEATSWTDVKQLFR